MNILNDITKKYLKLNKKRTIVTIIGIIISGAMISAVTTLAVSFQGFMIETEKASSGAWESSVHGVRYEDLGKIQDNEKIKNTYIMKPISIAENDYSDDDFIRIYGYEKDALAIMNGNLIEGRMPENENEIVLSYSFFDGKESDPKIGDKVKFRLGQRIDDGEELISQKKRETEQFVYSETKEYIVVGKMQKPIFETYNDNYTSGITIFNVNTLKEGDIIDVGLMHKDINKIYETTEQIAKDLGLYIANTDKYDIKYNEFVLIYMGVSDDVGFYNMMYSVCGILILVIMVGSILVIYNSFAISVSERKKQFGMLSSIGATKKQINKSVKYEGVVLGIVGIPLGIIFGILGIGITLKIVDGLLQPLFAKNVGNLELIISWPAILIAIVIIAITIYLSVMIPAKRASKITPIDAIRQTADIKVKAKKLRTPKFIRKIFGIQGELALKSLKRSKKRYRTTVISLIISIVLFITVSGFVEYMFSGFNTMYMTLDYDYAVSLNAEDKAMRAEILNKIKNLEESKQVTAYKMQYIGINIPVNKMNEKLKEKIDEENKQNGYMLIEEIGDYYSMTAMIYCLDDETYDAYLKKIGLNKLNENEYIIINYSNLIQGYHIETEIVNLKNGEAIETSLNIFEYDKESDKYIEKDETAKIVKTTKEHPFGVSENMVPRYMNLITSQENYEKICKEAGIENNIYNVVIKSDNVDELEKRISELNERYPGYGLDDVLNVKEALSQMQNLKLVIQIFLYGFIVLISAIGISNVFNTISTNIGLRRREFANLKSIGMTNKQFKQMLNLECVFYGTKALLYGIPIGILLCYLLNLAFANAVEFLFNIPWMSIIISIIAVYLVVFMTMIYASRKVKKENIIDIIRDDNV